MFRDFKARACWVILLTSVLTAGCRTASPPHRAQRLTVLATTYPIWLFTKAVVGDSPGVTVQRLLPAGAGCPHEYSLTVEDARLLSGADMLVINGLGLDAVLEQEYRKQRPKAPVIDTSQGIAEVIVTEEGKPDDHGHEHHAANPHLFASPLQAARIVENLAQALGRADSAHAAQYQNNAQEWSRRLRELAQQVKTAVERLPHRSVVVQHDVFDYFARDTGLHIAAVITTHPGEDISAAELRSVVQAARKQGARAVFTEPQYSPEIGETIARELGIPHATLDPVATGPDKADLNYYVKAMERNKDTLVRVLNNKE